MADNGRLIQIFGDENVLDASNILEQYSKDMSLVPRTRPRCVVRPENTDELKALITWANETLTTLVPVSSGGPHFRGDTVPSSGGAVIVDLSRMNQIMRIDRKNRVAMVEPGVTFTELIPPLEKEGLRLNMPFLPRESKSIIGSMLEREPVIMPVYQWDSIDPLTCIEILFGTGDLFRTGSAAGPGSLEEQRKAGQAQVNPMGPGQTDFAKVVQGAQGTMGIVSWATIRCETLPSMKKSFLVGSRTFDKLTDFIYRMLWFRAVEECLVLNSINLASVLSKDIEENLRIKDSLPSWILFLSLAGYDEFLPEERIQYQEDQMVQASQKTGVDPVDAISGISAHDLSVLLTRPSKEPYWKIRNKGGCQEIFFVTTLDRVTSFVDILYKVAEGYNWPLSDIGIYVQPMVQGTSCHCEFTLFYDPCRDKEQLKMKELYDQACEALMNSGAFFSRPYGSTADMSFRRDAETTAALRKVKQIFDPNNIMNSGKLCF